MSAERNQEGADALARDCIAVLLPCRNEELTIGEVVRGFRKSLPAATIFVYDNASTDNTAKVAAEAGATVRFTPRRGKGNVVRQMFREVDAEIYIMADGDGTYSPDEAQRLVDVIEETGADMVVGTRLSDHGPAAFRAFHVNGNRFISKMISMLFRAPVTDVLSGYRAFRRTLVHSMYLKSTGFEIETEMTLQALVRDRTIMETPIRYGSRPEGSESKLNTFSDGMNIFRVMFLIFRDYKPLMFFSTLSVVCFVLGLWAGWIPVADYLNTRYVSHVPLALLAAALEILAVVLLGIGLTLNAIRRFNTESQEFVSRVLDRMPRSDKD